MSQVPYKQIRALHDERLVRVYQAYSTPIASAALRAGRFVAPFKRERMTWVKPSFLWMMYRAGWGMKDPGQQCVLAIDITREGFEWALRNSCLAKQAQHLTPKPPVRVQWDPERDVRLQRLDHRSLQMGLSGPAVAGYVDEWTERISDVTELAHTVKRLVDREDIEGAVALLPRETPYPTPTDIRDHLGMDEGP